MRGTNPHLYLGRINQNKRPTFFNRHKPMCFTIITTDSFLGNENVLCHIPTGEIGWLFSLQTITNSFHRIASSVARLQWDKSLYSALSLPILIGGKTTFTPYYDFHHSKVVAETPVSFLIFIQVNPIQRVPVNSDVLLLPAKVFTKHQMTHRHARLN